MGTRTIRTTALPELDNGDIWGTRDLGIFVVISQETAKWRGEDRDIYAHINTWYTVRDATPTEIQLWDNAVVATTARRVQRKQLNAERFDYVNGELKPTSAMTSRLDSYSDDWNPPAPVILTPEQIAVEENYITARKSLKTGEIKVAAVKPAPAAPPAQIAQLKESVKEDKQIDKAAAAVVKEAVAIVSTPPEPKIVSQLKGMSHEDRSMYAEVKKRQSERTPRAVASDNARTADTVFSDKNPEGVNRWLRHPEHADIQGVDAGKGAHITVHAKRRKAVDQRIRTTK